MSLGSSCLSSVFNTVSSPFPLSCPPRDDRRHTTTGRPFFTSVGLCWERTVDTEQWSLSLQSVSVKLYNVNRFGWMSSLRLVECLDLVHYTGGRHKVFDCRRSESERTSVFPDVDKDRLSNWHFTLVVSRGFVRSRRVGPGVFCQDKYPRPEAWTEGGLRSRISLDRYEYVGSRCIFDMELSPVLLQRLYLSSRRVFEILQPLIVKVKCLLFLFPFFPFLCLFLLSSSLVLFFRHLLRTVSSPPFFSLFFMFLLLSPLRSSYLFSCFVGSLWTLYVLRYTLVSGASVQRAGRTYTPESVAILFPSPTRLHDRGRILILQRRRYLRELYGQRGRQDQRNVPWVGCDSEERYDGQGVTEPVKWGVCLKWPPPPVQLHRGLR